MSFLRIGAGSARAARILLFAAALAAALPGTAARDAHAGPTEPQPVLHRARDAQEATLLAVFRHALTPEQYCELLFLLHLGWQFERDPDVEVLTVNGGRPCSVPTLEAAQERGWLRIKIPPGFDVAQARAFGRSVGLLADGGANRCAYKQKVAVATREAVRRIVALTESGRYVFPHLLEMWESPWFRMSFPRDEWKKRGKAFVASRSSAEAMAAFLHRGATAECYVGQAMAIYVQQYLLYGHEWFEEVFAPPDVWIGMPRFIKGSPLGRYTRSEIPYRWRALLIDLEHQRWDPALALARFGPTAFVGASGIVMNQTPGEQSNENFVIVSVSKRAMDDIVRGGGLKVYAEKANEIFRVLNAAQGVFKPRSRRRAANRRIDRILDIPIFKEVKVYVHPYGVVDIAYLYKKKMLVTDLPLKVVIYTFGREEFLFQRYRAAYKRFCMQQLGHDPDTLRTPDVALPTPDERQTVSRGRRAQPPPRPGAVVPASTGN